jgi:hypothetical protein
MRAAVNGMATMKKLSAATLTLAFMISSFMAPEQAAWAQALPQVTSTNPNLLRTNPSLMITPQQALTWATYKNGLGPTYTGSPAGNQWVNFIMTTMQEFGAVDLYVQNLPYNLFSVPDWPNPQTHIYGSGVEVEKLISNGASVPVVASYVQTSGATPTEGLTAPMVFCPSTVATSGTVTTTCPSSVAGKILVCQVPPYPAASPGINGPYSYTSGILQLYAYTDAEVRYQADPPGGFPLWTAVPPTVQTSQYYRWNFTMLSSCQKAGQTGNAAGMIFVYDVSPGGTFGLLLREVYAAAGSPAQGGPGTVFQNVPTLVLDRVNGAKVITDAQAGASASMWLLPTGTTDNCASTASTANGSPSCGFVPVQGQYVVGYLPGKYYGTPQDQYINIATHTDAQSLIEEDGALGMLGMMNYFNQIPQSQRPKTLQFWFDSRHFMPGAEGQWSVYDYFNLNPSKKLPVVAYMSLEHMGGRATQETGTPDGLGADTYSYINAAPQDGGDIDSLLTISNNNLFLINAVGKSAADNNWFRLVATSGPVQPGLQGGYQKSVNSAELKGSPGIGLAGDWPGAWTQSYSQLYSEANYPNGPGAAQSGAPGFDEDYFVRITSGMTELAGVMMAQSNLKITLDLGWGNIASGILCTTSAICTTTPSTGQLPDSSFINSSTASTQRAALFSQYQTAFQYVQQGQYRQAINAFQTLQQNVTSSISSPTALNTLIGNQITKLLAQPQVYTHDFNGDGLSDLLFRDTSGNLALWLMNGTSVLTSQTIANVPLNWTVVGQRDFNGDGNADILWRDNSGNVGMWLMGGNAVISTAVIGTVPSNWSIVGTGDFNGDGKADILWRDTSGDLAIWFMNGTTITQSAVVGNVPTNWAVAGSDMHGDIFWRDSASGDVSMWVMSGTSVTSTAALGVVPLSWTISAVGDFDNNGSTDLLWRDTSGNVAMWLLNGTAVQSTSVIANVPLNWTVTNTGDYNGDGKSDIIWTNTAGEIDVWVMDGATISTTSTYGNLGTYSVQVANAD